MIAINQICPVLLSLSTDPDDGVVVVVEVVVWANALLAKIRETANSPINSAVTLPRTQAFAVIAFFAAQPSWFDTVRLRGPGS
jgi:hypothetical protein